jgi:hypothetical protein
MFHQDVVKLGQRVDVLVAPVQEVLPHISYHLEGSHSVSHAHLINMCNIIVCARSTLQHILIFMELVNKCTQ